MGFIIKTGAAPLDTKGRVLVFAPPYGSAEPAAGDLVFLWFSETQGGSGLTHRGRIAGAAAGKEMPILVQVEASCPAGSLTKKELAAARENDVGLWGVAQKLYHHAHNKVAALAEDEISYLDTFFATPARRTSIYDALERLLREQVEDRFTLSFSEIEARLGRPLPQSAETAQWWANTTGAHTNVQREAWRRAGFNAFYLNGERKVRFERNRQT